MKAIVKRMIIPACLLLTAHAYAQKYILPDGEYMDTTSNPNSACKDYTIYYYQVGGKYPKSSITLLKEVQLFLIHQNQLFKGSGYITFRFRIDCEGQRTKRTQVLQTDEHYKSYHFNKTLVNELYLFLNTLNNWKAAKDKRGNFFSYIALLTFKIKDGKVINIIP